MHSQLLYIGSSAKALENYGGRTKEGLADWSQRPAHPKVSPLPFRLRGGREELSTKGGTFNALRNGLLKPTGNVGQHAKDNVQNLWCQ